MPNNRLLLSDSELREQLNISRTHLWKLRQDGTLPPPIKLGGKNYNRPEAILRAIKKLEKEAAS